MSALAAVNCEGLPYALTVLHPADLMGPKVGGAETFLREFLRFAPDALDLRVIGVTCDASARPPGRWTRLVLGKRYFDFLPILHEPDESRKTRIPIALRFAIRLSFRGLPEDSEVVLHNRMESFAVRGVRQAANIVMVHNDIPRQMGTRGNDVLWSRVPALYFAYERRVISGADRVLAVSTNTVDDYARRYSEHRDRVSFIPTCVDPERFHSRDVARTELRIALAGDGLGVDPDADWVLFVGRLTDQKAPLRLVESFTVLCRSRSRAQLLVVGDGDLLEATRRDAHDRGVGEHVHFLGALPQSRMSRLYQAADVLVLTSSYEGMPMCVLEALACGTPVVSTRVGEIAQVVKNGVNGEVVDSFDANAIAAAVARVLGAPQRYAMEACTQAVEPFTPQRVMAPLYRCIRDLALARRRSRRLKTA